MTGEDTTVDDAVDKAVARADTPPDTFRPVSVDDRFRKTVRDDHAPNAALHAAIKAAAEDDDRIHSVNLMGSHAPGNRHKGEPRYNVRVDVRNEGMGHPVLGAAAVVGRLVDRGDVRITDVVECSDDHLVVAIRPIETRVEPIEVEYRDLPDDVVRVDTLEDDAARTLAKAAQGPDVTDDDVHDVARALSTVVYTAAPDRYDDVPEPDAAPQAAFDALLEQADVDVDDFPPGPTVVPCGCGDYRVEFPSDVPDTFDVVCPECGNHFGQDGADE